MKKIDWAVSVLLRATPVFKVISEQPWHSVIHNRCWTFGDGFNDLDLLRPRFEPDYPQAGQMLYLPLDQCGMLPGIKYYFLSTFFFIVVNLTSAIEIGILEAKILEKTHF